jgi:hypothetical protein
MSATAGRLQGAALRLRLQPLLSRGARPMPPIPWRTLRCQEHRSSAAFATELGLCACRMFCLRDPPIQNRIRRERAACDSPSNYGLLIWFFSLSAVPLAPPNRGLLSCGSAAADLHPSRKPVIQVSPSIAALPAGHGCICTLRVAFEMAPVVSRMTARSAGHSAQVTSQTGPIEWQSICR